MENKSKVRIIFVSAVLFICFLAIIIKIGAMQLINTKANLSALNKLSTKIVYGDSMPRGRILDRNYNVLVDNIGINKISYKKEQNVSVKEEISIAYDLAKNIDISLNKLNEEILKSFWIAKNEKKAEKKITKEEYDLYDQRKIKAKELKRLKYSRITKEELNYFKDIDKEAAYVYYLMNNGYYYDEKTIKEEATDKEYAYVIENKNKLKGVITSTSWKRTYPYGDTLRQILGNVSSSEQGLPKDEIATYLNNGYSLNDRVGLSYLEKEYEDVLKGTKDKYEIKNGVKKLVSKGSRGKDVVLSIDINIQKELEKVLSEELINAKREPNTEFYNYTSAIITDPKTGMILAMSSKKINNKNGNYEIKDYTTSILTNSNPPGSVVKGASMLVGYSTGNLKFGDVFYDKCIKFKNTKEKCSWTSGLGSLNDITALQLSSNSYQFQLALKVAGIKYYYNMPIKIDSKPLDTYRNVFTQLGLGVKSGIDLPNETEGYKGKESNAGLLLNYSIGQYDSYTILQVMSYLNTIINDGDRLKLSLLKEVRDSSSGEKIGNVINSYEKQILNKVDIEKKYFDRVKLGFKSVMEGYLGRGYMGDIKDAAGKTGTSETFYDSDGDGVVDKETYSKAFMGYAPYDDPKISIVVISPHVRLKKTTSSYDSNVNKRISSRICNKLFEIYK